LTVWPSSTPTQLPLPAYVHPSSLYTTPLSLKELYAIDFDFKDAYENCREGRTWNKYMLQDGLLYRANKLFIPTSYVRLLFLQEAHGGGLMGYFGVKKTEDVLAAHFFWRKMMCDV
jgi:hypothetical protein